MSPSKRKSRHQDVVTYSDSDENSEKEHSKSSKTHRKKHKTPKEHEKDYSKYKSQKDNKEKDHKRKPSNHDRKLSDSEDLTDYRKEKDRRLNDDYSKDYRSEKRNHSPKSSDEEYSKKQRKDNNYSRKSAKDSIDDRRERNKKHFSNEENYREHARRKKNRDREEDSPEFKKKSYDEKRLMDDESKSDRRKMNKISKERFFVDDSDYPPEEYKKNQKKRYDSEDEASKDEEIKEQNNDTGKVDDVEPLSKRQKIVNINMRTGGAYIPPARLRMMQAQIKDKSSEQYQRIAWEALKKSIVGMTNKVNGSNIAEIIPELLRENIIRGRGILARAIMQAQSASPTFTRVYAALVAVINTKFPEIGELILKRLIIQYKRGFRRNDKTICMGAARFLAHLLNQEVAHEVLILEMVTHLLENPTEDSVEVAIACLKECGKKLTLLTARGMRAITQRVRDVLHEGNVDVRVRYMIEVFFAIQKDGFKDFEIISQDLDLVEEDDKYTHLINLDDAVDAQEMLNIFKFDPDYVENEEKYKSVVKEILGEGSDEEGSGNESDGEEEEDDGNEEKNDESQQIIDMTETNIVCLRRKIYLTVQSSLDFEECAHKLLKLELKPGQILEMCYMILDCCAQQRTYEKFFGLLAQRFCQLSKVYVEPFTEIFQNSYKTIHRLETNKLRNVAKFFAHLLYTDAISWLVLANIKLNEEDTTSSSRIFIKILFQELCEYMGLPKLNERVKDITLQEAFEGLFPRDHPHNTRFAINFFTSIGLGGLTDELREHLKNMPKTTAPVVQAEESPEEEEDVASSSSSSSSTSTSSTSSSSSSSDSDERRSKRRKKQKK